MPLILSLPQDVIGKAERNIFQSASKPYIHEKKILTSKFRIVRNAFNMFITKSS